MTAQVTIALQLPEGGRIQSSFSPQVTLWEIITHFEKNHQNINLTRQQGVAEGSKDKKLFYKQPVINFTNKEVVRSTRRPFGLQLLLMPINLVCLQSRAAVDDAAVDGLDKGHRPLA